MSLNPTLIIGIGGTGKLALLEIKKEMMKYTHNRYQFPFVRLLAIDTEFLDEKKEGFSNPISSGMDTSYEKKMMENAKRFDENEIVEIEVQKTNMKEYIRDPEKIGAGDFVSQDKIRGIEKEIEGYGAGGYGIVGKLALWDHITSIKGKLEGILRNFTDKDYMVKSLNRYNEYCDNKLYNTYEYDNNTDINVIVIGSVGGGTGKGVFLTLGVLINEILKAENRADNSMRILINYMPSCFTSSGRDVGSYIDAIYTNQYTSFKELEYVLKNGYPTEKSIKQLFNNREDASFSKQIYTDILNVSKRIDEIKVDIGSYEIINKTVSETVVSYIFSGLSGKLKAFFKSNKGTFKDNNKLEEKEAEGANRVRDYGRLGRHKLVLPISKLVDYAKLTLVENIVEDIKTGDVIAKELRKTRSENEQRPSEIIKIHNNKVKEFIEPKRYLDFQRPVLLRDSIKTKNFDDNILEQINQQTTTLLGTIENYITTGRMQLNEKEVIEKIMNGNSQDLSYKGIISDLKTMIKRAGLDYIRVMIKEIMINLKDEVGNIFTDDLEEINVMNAEKMTFDFERGYAELEKRLNEIKERLYRNVTDMLRNDYPGLDEINKALLEDKDKWTKENSKLFNKVLTGLGKPEDDKKISDNSDLKIREYIEKFNGIMKEYIQSIENSSCLRGYKSCYEEMKRISDIVNANKELVDTDGIMRRKIKEQKREIVKRDISILLNEIVGNRREEEYMGFTNYLNTKCMIDYDEIEKRLNERFMEEFVVREIKEEEVYASVKEYLDKLEEAKVKLSVTKYISELEESDQIKYINNLINYGAFLGEVDKTKVMMSGDLSSKFIFIETDDRSVIQKILKTLNKDKGVEYTESKSNEEIIITRLETALPLCVFSELHKAREVYLQKLKENGNTSEFKHQRHTHKEFVDIEEPIGSTSQMSESDKAMFIDLMLHTKLIEIDARYDLVKIYTPKEGLYKPFLDSRADKEKTELEQSILLDDFFKYLNQRYDWFKDFTLVFTQALLRVYRITKAEFSKENTEEYLKKYFIYDHNERKQFPYVPETLISAVKVYLNSLPAAPDVKSVLKFLEDNRKTNLLKIKEMVSVGGETTYCRSYSEVDKKFKETEFNFINIFEVKEMKENKTEETKEEVKQEKKVIATAPAEDEKVYFVSIGKNNTKKAKLSETLEIIHDNPDLTIYVFDEVKKKYVEYKNIEEINSKYNEKYGQTDDIPAFETEEDEIPKFEE